MPEMDCRGALEGALLIAGSCVLNSVTFVVANVSVKYSTEVLFHLLFSLFLAQLKPENLQT